MNSKKCICCRKNGHNITTCISAKKQGIMIENHIQAFIELKKKSKIYHYLRNLSITQQKILSSRIGEKKISYSIIFRYFLEKNKSKNIMLKLYGSTNNSRTLFSNPAEPIVCPSSSNTYNRKKILVA
jgi:hypothetical protein